MMRCAPRQPSIVLGGCLWRLSLGPLNFVDAPFLRMMILLICTVNYYFRVKWR